MKFRHNFENHENCQQNTHFSQFVYDPFVPNAITLKGIISEVYRLLSKIS